MPDVLTRDGTPLAFIEAGQGRPLLLVHGWATHGAFFQPQIEALSTRFRVIAPDLRGHGRSHRQGQRPSIDQLASDLADLVAALDLADALVVGWSMGAMVVWQHVLDNGMDRMSGMVVVDMAPKVVNGGDWSHGLRGSAPGRSGQSAADAMTADWPTVSRRVARRIFAEDATDGEGATREWVGREIAAADPAAMSSLWRSLVAKDFRDTLPRLTLPVLVTHGARSQLYGPATADWLVQALPDARRLQFDRSGHAPHLEEPERFNQAITEFAASLPPWRRGGYGVA